jgi:hypothetical protein
MIGRVGVELMVLLLMTVMTEDHFGPVVNYHLPVVATATAVFVAEVSMVMSMSLMSELKTILPVEKSTLKSKQN